MLKSLLTFIFALLYIAASLSDAHAATDSAPRFAPEIYSAKTAIVMFASGHGIQHDSKINIQKTIEQAIRENGRLTLVDDAAKADLIFVAFEKGWSERGSKYTSYQTVVDIFIFKGSAHPDWERILLEELHDAEGLVHSAGHRVKKFLKEVNDTAPGPATARLPSYGSPAAQTKPRGATPTEVKYPRKRDFHESPSAPYTCNDCQSQDSQAPEGRLPAS
jgi:hypothetical protein